MCYSCGRFYTLEEVVSYVSVFYKIDSFQTPQD